MRKARRCQDPSATARASFPGATVTLSVGDSDLGVATTDLRGVFRFERLTAGAYRVTVAHPGFEKITRDVTIGSTNLPSVDFVLAVERFTTDVSVTTLGDKATASRLPVPNRALPAQVGSVSEETMRQQGTNSVADALKNVSGVQAVRWYGAYEQYSIRGFFDADRDQTNVVLVDGMRRAGNRYGTQTDNLESIEVLKGPASLLYGRGAVGGVINLIRKRPEAAPTYDVAYRVGRFGTHQFSMGATGPVGTAERLLYRLDAGGESSRGWRHAGADRLHVSPTLTWGVTDHARLTLRQDFVRDRFDGDGGVPLNIVTLPAYRPKDRFSLPQDKVLVEDSQTQVLFDGTLSPHWQIRQSLLVQRTSDRYFVTEGVYGDPDANLVYREGLDFHHVRRPIQSQTDLVSMLDGLGRHNVLVGYEYQRDKYRTETTAGDDPDCLCGYWWLTIPPMDLDTLQETGDPLDVQTIERRTFVNDEVHAVYGQDQIDVLPRVKVNVGGRYDDYSRRVTRVGGLPFTPQAMDEHAFSYRAGVVVESGRDQQAYFGASSSFTPVTTIPPDGSALEPSTARNYEVGYRWQRLAGYVDIDAAIYHVNRNHLDVRESITRVIQAGEQVSYGLDLDVRADLGNGMSVLANYGVARARFEDSEDLTGNRPKYVPQQLGNVWIRKGWDSGVNINVGARFLGSQYADDANETLLDGYAILAAAVGYSARQWEWSLNADNLLDKSDYFLPGHFSNLVFPGSPFTISGTIRLKFR